ncbi:MAG: TetR/AcrR family transcriptional regulator [Pseudomonadota bacterium]
MAAAKSVMAETRIEAVTIDDIIQRAEVGKGSFYNHFASKEDLFFATLDEIIVGMTDRTMLAIKGIEDPAEVLSASIRVHIFLATEDPEVGRFIINAPASLNLLQRYADPTLNHNIDSGLELGRFKLRDRDLFFTVLIAGINATVLGQLENRLDESTSSEFARLVLVLAGLDRDDAHEVSLRPLPIVHHL